jgi:hypothetical protein
MFAGKAGAYPNEAPFWLEGLLMADFSGQFLPELDCIMTCKY